MSIKQQILRRIEEVKTDPTGSVADRISGEAFEALFAGVHSTEWTSFMKNFTENQSPTQLARLTLNDPQAIDPMLRQTLVYVAASSMCGAITIQTITNYVHIDILDKTLDCAPALAPPSGGGTNP
jgi:hypothetical protein